MEKGDCMIWRERGTRKVSSNVAGLKADLHDSGMPVSPSSIYEILNGIVIL